MENNKNETRAGVRWRLDDGGLLCCDTPHPGILRKDDTIEFGRWPQAAPYAHPIVWDVIAADDRGALLLSSKAVDAKPFDERGGNDWDESSLKAWLKGDFACRAFTEDERASIMRGPTCLSIGEFKTHVDGSLRTCEPTVTALDHGADTSLGSCCWWLRSPGDCEDDALAAYVNYQGRPVGFGFNPGAMLGVRPAVWIDMGSMI